MAKTQGAVQLKQWRSDAGLTLEEAAGKLRLSREWLRQVELGHVIPVKSATRDDIKRVMGIEPKAWEKKP